MYVNFKGGRICGIYGVLLLLGIHLGGFICATVFLLQLGNISHQ